MVGREKRRHADATDAPTPCEALDAKLRRVDHELQNLTRTGELFASGACERAPFPGLAFKGDDEDDELRLPLRKDDVQKIKTRGVVTQRCDAGDAESEAVAWEVDGELLALHNRRWPAFLEEHLSGLRETLGIAPAATVEMKLKSLLLVDTGGRIDPRQCGNARGETVFGRLMVVLPGAFEGGETVVHQQQRDAQDGDNSDAGEEEEMETGDEEAGDRSDGDDEEQQSHMGVSAMIAWQPGDRESPYDLAYTVLLGNCEYVAETVTSGTALCLVYDLMTANLSDVPMFVGPTRVQQSVESALSDFFNMAPEPLPKRFQLSPDAWRSINEFAVEHHFAYLIQQNDLIQASNGSLKIAESLAGFCAQSGGQYVLYLAEAVCSRSVHDPEEGGKSEVFVTVKAPWFRYGETKGYPYPPITMHTSHEVTPLGRVNGLSMRSGYSLDTRRESGIVDILTSLHGNKNTAEVCTMYALVIQPASIELRQIAKLPLNLAIITLGNLLTESREEALQYARRIINGHRSEWQVRRGDAENFANFLKIVVEINDVSLFNDLLLVLELETGHHQEHLNESIRHFGWDACVSSLVTRISTSSTLRGRVNLILSAFHESVSPARFAPLFDALLSLHPWTDVKVERSRKLTSRPLAYTPEANCFAMLLDLARAYPQTPIKMVTVKDATILSRLIVPVVSDLAEGLDDQNSFMPVILHLWELFKPKVPMLARQLYGQIQIPSNCEQCSEVQAFLRSAATETTILCPHFRIAEHVVRMVRTSCQRAPAIVTIEGANETSVQLRKTPGNDPFGRSLDPQEQKRFLRRLIFGPEDQTDETA